MSFVPTQLKDTTQPCIVVQAPIYTATANDQLGYVELHSDWIAENIARDELARLHKRHNTDQ